MPIDDTIAVDDPALAERLRADPEPRARDVVGAEGAPILDAASRWETLRVELPEPVLYVRPDMPLHLDPADWNAGFLRVTERELPPELFADLRELTPQSILRDLHRPVLEFRVTPEIRDETRVIGRWREGLEEVQQALVREPVPAIAPTVREVLAAQRERQAMLDEPWLPLLPDDAPRRAVQLYPAMELEERI